MPLGTALAFTMAWRIVLARIHHAQKGFICKIDPYFCRTVFTGILLVGYVFNWIL